MGNSCYLSQTPGSTIFKGLRIRTVERQGWMINQLIPSTDRRWSVMADPQPRETRLWPLLSPQKWPLKSFFLFDSGLHFSFFFFHPLWLSSYIFFNFWLSLSAPSLPPISFTFTFLSFPPLFPLPFSLHRLQGIFSFLNFWTVISTKHKSPLCILGQRFSDCSSWLVSGPWN